jgi:hypothetical protein
VPHAVRTVKHNSIGRPGAGRALEGRIRASILPALKVKAEQVAQADPRIRSLSCLVEFAVRFYLDCYAESKGQLNQDGLPVIR